jgi:lipopolysaccharide transport system ATP-binding protein
MNDVSLEMHGVHKKFRRGERHDSLRDLLPALVRRAATSVTRPAELQAEEFWALRDVSCVVRRGEAIGLIGHNGAGKSTVLKLVSGIMRPTHGRIGVYGRLSALIEVGAGFHQDLTGRENVYLNGVILGMTRAEVRRKFDEIVEFSGLADFIDTPVKRYSSGMYARLGFAVAAHLEPDILIVDEVLSVGDFSFQAKSIEKMRSVRSSGATVVFVSHNLRAMAELCDRALLLERGRLIEDGPTSHVIHTYMDRARNAREDTSEKAVFVESVTVTGADGRPRFDFDTGEPARIQVAVKARGEASRVACVIYLLDDNYYLIFQASSHLLSGKPHDFRDGDSATFTFDVDLNLGAGNYQLCVVLYRHETSTIFDKIEPAATLLVMNAIPMRGIVSLNPRLVATD